MQQLSRYLVFICITPQKHYQRPILSDNGLSANVCLEDVSTETKRLNLAPQQPLGMFEIAAVFRSD